MFWTIGNSVLMKPMFSISLGDRATAPTSSTSGIIISVFERSNIYLIIPMTTMPMFNFKLLSEL